jgi:NAD(P)-dependent dehydrogenase (short-subunit alcohol dehydrogenase family)/acyl dehydratase
MNSNQAASTEALRFGEGDLALFSLASHDVNPLHTSALYSRRTPFGQPVVFGVLGCLAAAAYLPDRPGVILSGVTAIFHGPLFVGVGYQVEIQDKGRAQSRVIIRDSGRIVASVTFKFEPGEPEEAPSEGACPRRVPLNHRNDDLRVGLDIMDVYAPEPAALAELLRRWGLPAKGIAAAQAAALLWTSYLVGMELPGERAVFSRLRITFPARTAAEGPIAYTGRVTDFDARYNLLEVEGRLSRGGAALADVQLSSLVRDDPPNTETSRLARLLPASTALEGQSALVTGGSRGLGAAIVAALASQGCHVLLNFRSGQADAEALRDSVGGVTGRITLMPGDAGDPTWCERMRSEWGRLDLLVLNASPAIRPLGLTPHALGRLSSFLAESFGLVAAPMASFLGVVRDRGGVIVLISSEYARTAPPEFPHYVAAKRAAEGLVLSACAEAPGTRLVVVRPPRLITDQTNTPAGREGAIPAESVAAPLVARLCEPTAGSPAEFLEEFPGDV